METCDVGSFVMWLFVIITECFMYVTHNQRLNNSNWAPQVLMQATLIPQTQRYDRVAIFSSIMSDVKKKIQLDGLTSFLDAI